MVSTSVGLVGDIPVLLAIYGMEEFVDCVCSIRSIFGQLCAGLRLPLLALASFLSISATLAESALPIVLGWAEPRKNEDESCLIGESPNCSKDLAGYRIYRAAGSSREFLGTPTLRAVISAPKLTFTDSAVQPGLYYRYLVTAVDTSGNESGRAAALDSYGLPLEGDEDRDGTINAFDNCPLVANPQQEDSDANGLGDACPLGHALAPTPNKPSCKSDRDLDGICDSEDNCPLIVNTKQEDSNRDGIGDACSRSGQRNSLRCQSQKESRYSSIAIATTSRAFLLDAESKVVAEQSIETAHSLDLVGDLRADLKDSSGFGELELLLSSPSNELVIHSSQRTAAELSQPISAVVPGDKIIGCYVDDDPNLDIVSYNNATVTTRSSLEDSDHAIDLKPYGKVRHISCGDFDGDGKDEIVLLHKPKKSANAASLGTSVTILNPLSGETETSYVVEANAQKVVMADLKGSGKESPCVLTPVDKTQASISCTKSGKRKIAIPPTSDLSVGNFKELGGKQGFALLGKNNKLAIVNVKGKIFETSADLTLEMEKLFAGKNEKMRLLNCR